MVVVTIDIPEEKLHWNKESLRAADAATDDPRASTLVPTVLANVGFSELLMARPGEARHWYEQALTRLLDADLPEERRDGYRVGIEHMVSLIDGSPERPA
ncbi:MAG: hypothetical protein E6G27_08930 [Actinobacteria bacterium]|nr:MAG: hypothetical protein E6G27_08930 [Actinomycetota bacterium]